MDTTIRENNRRGVVICGSYGYGDPICEAGLTAMIEGFRNADPALSITVISGDHKKTTETYSVNSVGEYNFPGFLRALRTCELLVVGGDLYRGPDDVKGFRRRISWIRSAKKAGCKVMMYGCGIGSIPEEQDRALAASVISGCVDEITLRDETAAEELRALGVKAPVPIVTGDPALAVVPSEGDDLDRSMEALNILPDESYAIFALQSMPGEPEAEAIARAADANCRTNGLKTVFLCDGNEAVRASEIAAEHMETPYIIISGMSAETSLGIIKRAGLLVSASELELLFAGSAGTPSVSLMGLSGYSADDITERAEAALFRSEPDRMADAEALRRAEQGNIDCACRMLRIRRGDAREKEDGPVRIAFFVNDFQVGGTQKALVNILKHLDSESCVTDVYYFDDELFYELPHCDQINYIKCDPLPYWCRFVFFGLLRIFYTNPFPDKQYDVAVDFGSDETDCSLMACSVRARKRVMFVHSDIWQRISEDRPFRTMWRFSRGKYRCFDEFAAASPGIVESFRQSTGVEAPVWIVPNYIDTKEIFEMADRSVPFRVDEDRYNVCAVGRLCTRKGFDILLDEFERAAEQRSDIHLYIIGDGPEKESLREMAREVGSGFNVSFLGKQSNPYVYMNKMDGLAVTSRYEGQGMAVFEAKALGLDLFVSGDLAAYYPGIHCTDSISGALLVADKHNRSRDSLEAYNRNISRQLCRVLGVKEL